jgi:ubiquinone/menaquinone biosynthesis C-methylase UbiE
LTEAYHEALDRVEADHWWFRALRRLVSEVLQANVLPPARILDIGCSTGHLLEALPAAHDRRGIDLNADAVAHARPVRPDIRFDVGSLEALPQDDASIDAAIAIDVISAIQVENDLQAVSEPRRILWSEGGLIAQLAAYEWLRTAHDEQVDTARRYTARRFKRLLHDGGFESVKVSYRLTALFPLAAAWRIMRRHASESDVAPVPRPINAILGARNCGGAFVSAPRHFTVWTVHVCCCKD